MDIELKDIVLNIQDHVELVHCDYAEKGIYQQKTIYLWTYAKTERNVENIVHKLYPNKIHIFEPSRKKDQNCDDKIILKINQTLTELPFKKEEEKRCKLM